MIGPPIGPPSGRLPVYCTSHSVLKATSPRGTEAPTEVQAECTATPSQAGICWRGRVALDFPSTEPKLDRHARTAPETSRNSCCCAQKCSYGLRSSVIFQRISFCCAALTQSRHHARNLPGAGAETSHGLEGKRPDGAAPPGGAHVNGVTKCRWPVVASDKHQRDWFRPYNRVPCRSM